MKWSPAAEEALNIFLHKYQKQFTSGDVDTEDLLEDVRCHIHEELKVLNVSVVTADHLEKIIRASHFDLTDKQEVPVDKTKAYEFDPQTFTSAKRFYYFFLAILLPIAAAIIELIWHPFADIFFDPLPNFLHIVICLATPLSNWLMYTRISTFKPISKKILLFDVK